MNIAIAENPADDGLDALVAKLNARYEQLALASNAPHADHLSLAGGRLTIRKRPASTLQFNPTAVSLMDQTSNQAH